MAADEPMNREPFRSVRTRALVTRVVTMVGAFALLIAATISQERILIVLLIIVSVAAWIYSFTFRCPRCGTPIFKRKMTIDGIDVTYWGSFGIPRTCSRCGLELP